MSGPITPIPTSYSRYNDYRNSATSSISSTTSYSQDSDTVADDEVSNNVNLDIYNSNNSNVCFKSTHNMRETADDTVGDDGCRDYHREDRLFEILERNQARYAATKPMDPSRVKVLYSRSYSKLGDNKDSHIEDTLSKSAYHRRQVYQPVSQIKRNARVKETSEVATNIATFVISCKAIRMTVSKGKAIIKWALICFALLLISVIVSCAFRDYLGSKVSWPQMEAALKHCDSVKLSGHYSFIVDTNDKIESPWWWPSVMEHWMVNKALFHRLTKQTFVQSSALSNHHPPLSSGKPTRAFDYAAPTSDNGGTIASYKMTPKIVRQNGNGGNQSSKAMRIDVQQIMRHFSSNHWIKDKLRSLLQNEIPVQILLAKDHTNEKVQVPVEFWEELGESLDSKKSVTFTIVEDLMNHDVCEKNKHRTQTLLPMLLGTKGNPGTALNQKEFVNLVASELQALWTDLEGWTKSAIHSQLYQWKKEKARMALSGDQTKDAISFIEQRLLVELVHQAKTIYYYCRFGRMNRIRDRPIQSKSAFQTDFALYNSGGRILPHLTSPYYHRCKPTPLFGRFFGLQKLIPRPFSQELSNQLATRAIQTGLQPGDCWPMLGNYGQISIWLTRRIIVTAVTIEHVDVRLSLDLKSAPREMEIWRLAAPIESIFQKSSSWSWPHSRPVRDDTYKKHDAMKDKKSSILGTWYKQGSPTFGASLLTTITYQRQHQWNMSDDPTEETETIDIEAAQLFSIPPLRQNVPSYGVMIRILSNWGHPDFTCLYRIHVHGFEA